MGKSCIQEAKTRKTTFIHCTDSVISPGFINLHEHLDFSTFRPLADNGVKVNHRHDWRVGTRRNERRETEVNGSVADAVKWGELRHVFSGTTSIVGGPMASGLTRNLDHVAGLEAGLYNPAATWAVFPLDDMSGILRNGDCDYGPNATTGDTAGKIYRYLAHVGEGVDAEAANEFQCFSSETYDVTPAPAGGGLSYDIIAPNLALVHALGLTEADFDLVAERGAHVVWSPRSNVFLYGKTLNVSYLLEAGVNVALGTDWLPSGSATMAREAVCALSVTKESYKRTIESKTMWEMMTINAAHAASFEDHIGSLAPSKLADIVIFSTSPSLSYHDPFARAIYAPEENIELVMRGGKILVAGTGLEDLATGACESVAFGDVTKTICVEEELGASYVEFEKKLGGVYPAILPCVPPDEPSCEPTR
ncbi:metal dependent amidohydrolase [Mytilinidion resinicola]|uniref:Metal dependent amidohydrolase n=1 Tax=Mytilinidion resinicola TaxID=574789 RepID=A0A6A6YUQ2_9PEZI|nr:metal dependent amidohydrolase [Mytilinidion resinicola]KAF2812662.1 metal dependent amidohydrolase [Mytilinidion resinicola]